MPGRITIMRAFPIMPPIISQCRAIITPDQGKGADKNIGLSSILAFGHSISMTFYGPQCALKRKSGYYMVGLASSHSCNKKKLDFINIMSRLCKEVEMQNS